MKHIARLSAIIGLLSFAWTGAHAVPAFPGEITYTQPDGTVVKYRVRGDEHRHWMETLGGHLLKFDASGRLMYAIASGDSLLCSHIAYTGNDAQALKHLKLLRPNDVTVEPKEVGDPSLSVGPSFPTTGKRKLLMLLVNYADTQPIISRDQFDAMMNAEGYNGIGSFRDYFLENSYGQLDIETTVVGWINLSYSKLLYSTDDITSLISEAISAIDDQVDFTQFDNDGDGVLDGLSIIHQGYGQEVSGSTNDVWSHSGDILSAMYADGIRIRTYTIQPELLRDNTQTTVGVFCHEFGHNLGAPDFYDTDYEQNGGMFPGTGVWDIMCDGSWEQYNTPGDSPTHFNMWQKMQFGWVVPQYLTESCSVADIPAASDEPVGYIVRTHREGDYYVLENRIPQGFDRTLPGNGLIVYHADENRIRSTLSTNRVNIDYNQGLYTVCASATSNPGTTVASFGDINSAGAPFPGNTRQSEFSDYTTPSAHSNDGKYGYFTLRNIQASGSTASFDFVREQAPDTVRNFTAAARRGIVTLTWEAPASGSVRCYRIFRDGNLLTATTALQYVDNSLTATVAAYQVDVEYATGLYSPYVTRSVRVPDNKITSIASSTDWRGVTLWWELNSTLTRMNPDLGTAMENSQIVTLTGSNVALAHRFSAADLKAYVGYTVERICFFPYTSQREVTYNLCIYQIGDDGVPHLVSTRRVSEYGSGSWTRSRLTTPVTIEAGYDYIIAFEGVSSIGTVTVVCDNTTYDPGLGNLVKTGDEPWSSDRLTSNVFLYAELSPCTLTVDDFTAGESAVFDPSADPLAATFPLGFNIYRNDQLAGFTSRPVFVDSQAVEGYNTYGIACLYEGNNESRLSQTSVYYTPSGADNPLVASATVVAAADGAVCITATAAGVASVYSADGRAVASRVPVAAGIATSIEVGASGVYIVKFENNDLISTYKIIIK